MFFLRAYLGALALFLLCLAASGVARVGEVVVAALVFIYLLLDLHAQQRALDRAEAALAALNKCAAG